MKKADCLRLQYKCNKVRVERQSVFRVLKVPALFLWLEGLVSGFIDLLCIKSMDPILYWRTAETEAANSRRESRAGDQGVARETFKTISWEITALRRLYYLVWFSDCEVEKGKAIYSIKLLPFFPLHLKRNVEIYIFIINLVVSFLNNYLTSPI